MTIFDLYTEQGSDFTQDISLGYDLTGYTIRGSAVDSTGTSMGAVVSAFTDDSTGAFTLGLSNAITSDRAVGVGKYDVEVVDGSGLVSKVLKGRIYISGEVTV